MLREHQLLPPQARQELGGCGDAALAWAELHFTSPLPTTPGSGRGWEHDAVLCEALCFGQADKPVQHPGKQRPGPACSWRHRMAPSHLSLVTLCPPSGSRAGRGRSWLTQRADPDDRPAGRLSAGQREGESGVAGVCHLNLLRVSAGPCGAQESALASHSPDPLCCSPPWPTVNCPGWDTSVSR